MHTRKPPVVKPPKVMTPRQALELLAAAQEVARVYDAWLCGDTLHLQQQEGAEEALDNLVRVTEGIKTC